MFFNYITKKKNKTFTIIQTIKMLKRNSVSLQKKAKKLEFARNHMNWVYLNTYFNGEKEFNLNDGCSFSSWWIKCLLENIWINVLKYRGCKNNTFNIMKHNN